MGGRRKRTIHGRPKNRIRPPCCCSASSSLSLLRISLLLLGHQEGGPPTTTNTATVTSSPPPPPPEIGHRSPDNCQTKRIFHKPSSPFPPPFLPHGHLIPQGDSSFFFFLPRRQGPCLRGYGAHTTTHLVAFLLEELSREGESRTGKAPTASHSLFFLFCLL